jgi:hypothetical protein
MNTDMIAVPKAEASFNHSITIDLIHDKKLYLGINMLSVFLFVFFYFAFYYASLWAVPNAGKSIFYYFILYRHLSGLYSLLFLPMLAFMMVFHELIHGFFLYLFTKSKPVFGFKYFMAYAGAPDWYIRKDCYIIVALAPFVIITLLCYLLLFVVSDNLLPQIFLTAVINASGCIGDIYYTVILLNKPKETYITDSGVVSIISYN